ncbi:mitochondrial inner membrane protease subunit 1-like, partial [Thraustotheca clavata]
MSLPRWVFNGLQIGAAAYCLKKYVGDVILGLGPSMTPTIPDGTILLVDRMSLKWRPVQAGDIILAYSPVKTDASMCKRVIAMEGQIIKRRRVGDDNTEEDYIKIPPGHIWVEGDNSSMSVDSRHYGPIPLALVFGRVAYKVLFSCYSVLIVCLRFGQKFP